MPPEETPEQMSHAVAASAIIKYAEADALAKQLRFALDQSVRLQSHYAKLLNQYDGGRRHVFKSSDEWLARLREMESEVKAVIETGFAELDPRDTTT